MDVPLPAQDLAPDELAPTLAALIANEHDRVANLANAASLLFWNLHRVNWAGFYLLRHDALVLGPFHGRPACVRIASGRGVCGTAAAERRTVVVPDVHAFPGHIACDAASRSEIVIPMLRPDGTLEGVLDLDSPDPDRFSPSDRIALEAVVAVLMAPA